MANFLSKTRMADLQAQLKFFTNLTINFDGRTTVAERIAINNYKMAICDLMCINNQVDGMERPGATNHQSKRIF